MRIFCRQCQQDLIGFQSDTGRHACPVQLAPQRSERWKILLRNGRPSACGSPPRPWQAIARAVKENDSRQKMEWRSARACNGSFAFIDLSILKTSATSSPSWIHRLGKRGALSEKR